MIFEHTNDKGFYDVKCYLGVRMRELFGSIDELVASEEELGNVSTHIVHQIEFAARVE